MPPAAALPSGLAAPLGAAVQAMPQPAVQPPAAAVMQQPLAVQAMPPVAAPMPVAAPGPPAPAAYTRPLGNGGSTHPMFEGLPPSAASAPQPASASMPQPAVSHVVPTPPQAAGPAVAFAVTEHHALRVAVAPADASGELRVKLLGPYEAAPAGTRLGLLVGLDAWTKLVG